MAKQIWVQISDVDGALLNYEISPNGRIRRFDTKKAIKPRIYGNYYLVTLRQTEDRTKSAVRTFYVHHLVAKHFIANDDPEHKKIIVFKDGNRLNVCAENLAWMSRSENSEHQVELGTSNTQKGENNNCSKYTEEDINNVCRLLEDGMGNKMVSRITGIPIGTIAMIKSGGQWPYISSKYNIPKKSRNRVTDSDFDGIVNELIVGEKEIAEIAKVYGVNPSYIYAILNRHHHKKRLKGVIFNSRYTHGKESEE